MPKKSSSPAAQRRLADFMCFSIYSANLAFGRAYKPVLDELGITYTQWIAIVALWEEDNLTVKGLGERLFLESNTLTPILKKLEELGYIRRQRDPSDERQVRVSLTAAGRALRERGGKNKIVNAIRLTPEEFAQVQKAVARLRDDLIEQTQLES